MSPLLAYLLGIITAVVVQFIILHFFAYPTRDGSISQKPFDNPTDQMQHNVSWTMESRRDTSNANTRLLVDDYGTRLVYRDGAGEEVLPEEAQMLKFVRMPFPSRDKFWSGSTQVYTQCFDIAKREGQVICREGKASQWAYQPRMRAIWCESLYRKI